MISKSKSGVYIQPKFEMGSFDLIKVGRGRKIAAIEEEVRAFRRRFAEGDQIGIEIGGYGPGPLYRTYFNNVDEVIKIIQQYKASGKFDNQKINSIRIIRAKDITKTAKRRAIYDIEQKAIRARKKAERGPPKKRKTTARSRAVNKYAMQQARSDPAYAAREKERRKELREGKLSTKPKGKKRK
jgi:hypothetical protein